ncbi:MAG TPA: SUF system Fe-S cluster assembly protein [Devosia sp.]|jgi:FeS assembly SUF system protein|nr:SUF system Fe-S cluster assembly protein [Devosia sp.]
MTDEPVEIAADTAATAIPDADRTDGNRVVPNVGSSIPPEEVARITTDLIQALKTVYDPEIPVDIYELGLIYKVDLDDDRNLTIDMTLTAPGCPVAGEMPGWVENAAMGVEGIQGVTVNMVYDPPWDQSRMSEEAQVALNWW